jgi:hypothetical protein
MCGLDPALPDWQRCRVCHDATTEIGAWFRSLRHEPVPRDAQGRRLDGADRVRGWGVLAGWLGVRWSAQRRRS